MPTAFVRSDHCSRWKFRESAPSRSTAGPISRLVGTVQICGKFVERIWANWYFRDQERMERSWKREKNIENMFKVLLGLSLATFKSCFGLHNPAFILYSSLSNKCAEQFIIFWKYPTSMVLMYPARLSFFRNFLASILFKFVIIWKF